MCKHLVVPAVIGAELGLVYGILLWFIKSQIIGIYSQGVAFRVYYDPNMVAFIGASTIAVLGLAVILLAEPIYNRFEKLALAIKARQDALDEEDSE